MTPTDPTRLERRRLCLWIAVERNEVFADAARYHVWTRELPGGPAEFLGTWDREPTVQQLKPGDPDFEEGRTRYRDTLPDGRVLIVEGTSWEMGAHDFRAERFQPGVEPLPCPANRFTAFCLEKEQPRAKSRGAGEKRADGRLRDAQGHSGGQERLDFTSPAPRPGARP